MNTNLRRRGNTGQFAAVLRWVILLVFISASGLSYVYLKTQMHMGGLQKRALERELSDLISQNNVMEAQIAQLTSPTALRRRMEEGFIKLIPISTQSIVRVRTTSDGNRWLANEQMANDFHPVSHELVNRR